MEIQIVLTTDESIFSRLARWLGAEWTHSMLRFRAGYYVDSNLILIYGYPLDLERLCPPYYEIIEASFRHGVVERTWNPEEYSRWAVYKVKPQYITSRHHETILAYARGNVGKWYAFDRLALLIPHIIRTQIGRILYNAYYLWLHPRQVPARINTRWSIIFTGQRAHICSSLVDDSFTAAGLDLVRNNDTPWVLPDDIRGSPLLEKIEEWPDDQP